MADALDQDTISGADWGKAIALWLIVFLVRATMLLILSPLLYHSGNGFGVKRAMVMTWGGLR